MSRSGGRAAAVEDRAAGTESERLSDVSIVRAARGIIADVGVEGLTMRRLSAELGVALGATYHHVPTKRALMTLVVQDFFQGIEYPTPGHGDWADQVKEVMLGVTRAFGEYPGLAAYMMTHVDDAAPVALQQAIIAELGAAGFSAHTTEVVMSALYFYGIGVSATLIPLRQATVFEGVDVPGLLEEGLDMVLAGARVRLEADLARSASTGAS